jgi:hypothetical protein
LKQVDLDPGIMKDQHDITESVPDKGGVRPVTVAVSDVELTPKEEAAAATLVPPGEQLAEIEQKLEHDATVANQLPKAIQLAKFEQKLEHDDSGNQPS